ncbi:glycosyltransferase family 2 protein [Flavobacterium sp. RSP15]|uniref:glycosyltransferase family 2 protein n=1 Tax=Flavobacterium sp. RSP15 TaxID=2497485 RepID=UPI000F83EFE1|nr:glycosyltransferase family A protein [Flavobacterium sp. RSP15]RTY85571.1 glycosyltransferase family 2 protein [Flavobacterium sp. RSP15]
MHSDTLVSIIIPCYNDAQYILQSVNSALNQTYPNKEVIVVDDGSNAETKAVLKKLAPKITKLITQENQGQSTARNNGIREAAGEYILVLDSDDYFEPTFCEKAIEIILKNKEIKLVTCQANLFFEDGSSYVFIPKGGSIANFLYINDALGTSMFKKEDWLSCGCYDENMKLGYEDWEFFIRLLKTGGEVEVIKEPLYNYRKRDNTTSSKSKKIKYDLLKYIYIKHKDLYISDFDVFVSQLLFKIEIEEIEKIKNTKRLEFQIGTAILSPLRRIKRLLR